MHSPREVLNIVKNHPQKVLRVAYESTKKEDQKVHTCKTEKYILVGSGNYKILIRSTNPLDQEVEK
jgi:hypothetical protein